MNPDSNAEAGPSNSNDIELQDTRTMDSFKNAYHNDDPWSKENPETISEYNRFFKEPDSISRSSSPTGSDSTVRPSSTSKLNPEAEEFIPEAERLPADNNWK